MAHSLDLRGLEVDRTLLFQHQEDGRSALAAWLEVCLRWAALPLHFVVGAACVVSFYSVMLLVLVLYNANADMLDALGRGLEVSAKSVLLHH